MPYFESSLTNGLSLSSPSSPPHTTRAPRNASHLATFTALPPTFSSSATSLNISPPPFGAHGSLTVASIAGLMHKQ